MNPTQITFRKTPHAKRKRNTIFGEEEYVETRYAWDFLEKNNFDSPVVWRDVPLPQCHVKSGMQDCPDKLLRPEDMRSCTVDVFKARQHNMDLGFGWKTNWEILQKQEDPMTLECFL